MEADTVVLAVGQDVDLNYGFCPDNAIVTLGEGKGFRIDLDFCKGCRQCAKECPAGAIRMLPGDV